MTVRDRGARMDRRRALAGLSFVAPWILGFLLFSLYPLGLSLVQSFEHVVIVGAGTHFVGLFQYDRVLAKGNGFPSAFRQSFVGMVENVPLIVIFALSVALLLDRRLRGATLFKAIFFIPVALGSSAVIGVLIQFGGQPKLYNTTEATLLASTVGPVLAHQVVKVLGGIATVIWSSGIQILLLIAGLRGLPRQVYEAARVDGGNTWQIIHKITLPLLRPTLFVVALYSIIVWFTASNNPMMQYMELQFLEINIGKDAAAGWLYFVGVLLSIGVVALFLERQPRVRRGG